MALRPAYVTLSGIESTLQITADVWMWDGSLAKGIRDQLIIAEEEDPLPIEWATENYGIATVNAQGLVGAVSAGETLITATIGQKEATSRVIVVALDNPFPQVNESPPPEGQEGSTPVQEKQAPAPAVPPSPEAGPKPAQGNQPSTPSGSPAGGSPSAIVEMDPPSPSAPYADRVVSFTPGTGGGFHQDLLPDIVLGPPKGAGLHLGSLDVVSLGRGGEIVLEFTDFIIFNGPGVDFTVFENAFQIGSDPDNTFAEPGRVAVSHDGVNFFEFDCNASVRPYHGCAGVHPTLANPDSNDIDPTDPSVSGGDSFDLAEVGLQTARFVRIRDASLGAGPIGPGTAGFDLDAVAIVHGTLP